MHPKYVLHHKQDKAHGRILWDISWSADSRYLLTGSRDKTFKLWEVGGSQPPLHQSMQRASPPNPEAAVRLLHTATEESGVTACCIGPVTSNGLLLVIGTEAGPVRVWMWDGAAMKLQWEAPEGERHVGAVRRLQWVEEEDGDGGKDSPLLASCGEDWAVKVWRWRIK